MDEHWTALLHVLIQGGSRTATFDLGSSMTSEGLLLETAIICTITGPKLPPLLVKVPITSPFFICLLSCFVFILPLCGFLLLLLIDVCYLHFRSACSP